MELLGYSFPVIIFLGIAVVYIYLLIKQGVPYVEIPKITILFDSFKLTTALITFYILLEVGRQCQVRPEYKLIFQLGTVFAGAGILGITIDYIIKNYNEIVGKYKGKGIPSEPQL